MTRIISILSGKGGAGKTFLTAAMGTVLSRRGRKVLVADGDMGLRNLDLVLGLENEVFYTIWDAARGRCFPKEAILTAAPGLDFLAAAQNEDWESLSADAVATVFEDVAGTYDDVLIDCPAGLGEGTAFPVSLSDQAVVVAAPSWASLRDSEQTLSFLKDRCPAKVVLNQVSLRGGHGLSFSSLEEAGWLEKAAALIPYAPEADRLAQEGRLTAFNGMSLFGTALSMAVDVLTGKRDYDEEVWTRLLSEEARQKEREEVPREGLASALCRRSLSWKMRRRY